MVDIEKIFSNLKYSFQLTRLRISQRNCAIWRLSEHALSTTCILESTLHAAHFLQFQAYLGNTPKKKTKVENCLLSKDLYNKYEYKKSFHIFTSKLCVRRYKFYERRIHL